MTRLRALRSAALALAAAALPACVANPPKPLASAPAYAPPSGGPLARLTIRVNHVSGHSTISTFEQPVGCSLRREIASVTAREPVNQPFNIVANRLQTLSFLHVGADKRTCEILFSFEPRAGNSYLMRNAATSQGCRVELFNTTNPDSPAVERTGIRRERVGVGLNDNACKPLMTTVRPRGPAEGRDAPAGSLDPFIELLPGK